MKKSTILLLVVVYILSFFIIGLLGHSIRNYNPEIYPESLTISEPDKRTEMSKDVVDEETNELLYHYYFVYKNYKSGESVRIKADVKPDNTNWPTAEYKKDESDTSFKIETNATNPNIEKNYFVITPLVDVDTVLSTPFSIKTANPGTKIELKICITFVNPALS